MVDTSLLPTLQTVNATLSGLQERGDVARLQDGRFIAVWTSIGQDGDAGGVYGRILDSDGTPLGDEFRLNDTTAGNQNSPVVAALADGGYMVSWADGNNRIVIERFDSDGLSVESRDLRVFSSRDTFVTQITPREDGSTLLFYSMRMLNGPYISVAYVLSDDADSPEAKYVRLVESDSIYSTPTPANIQGIWNSSGGFASVFEKRKICHTSFVRRKRGTGELVEVAGRLRKPVNHSAA